MTPFLAEELSKMMMEMIEKFVKKDAITSGSISSLMYIDIYADNDKIGNFSFINCNSWPIAKRGKSNLCCRIAKLER